MDASLTVSDALRELLQTEAREQTVLALFRRGGCSAGVAVLGGRGSHNDLDRQPAGGLHEAELQHAGKVLIKVLSEKPKNSGSEERFHVNPLAQVIANNIEKYPKLMK